MSTYQTEKTFGDSEFWREARFGMFIHWGIYALPARGEWVKTIEMTSEEKYDQYFKYFDPDLYDPREWAKQAKAAGMKYAVITTKHHDGFCLFDSKYTDYKATNTPAGRDLLREFVDAFRAEGLHIGFYYSLLDWHHPDFPIDWLHPRKKDPDREKLNEGRDMHRYAEYMRNQLTELLTNYGKIEFLWCDFSYTNRDYVKAGWPVWMKSKGHEDWESDKLIETVRKLQPWILINDRMGVPQDFVTPEQTTPEEWPIDRHTGKLANWESCQTFSGAWGYNRDLDTWKSPKQIIDLLINNVCCGGNLLMNVGPTARGYLDQRTQDALKVFADWMKYNSRSIYGCTMAEPEFKTPRDCRFTQSNDGKRLYLHLINYPSAPIEVPCLAGKVDYAQFLHDGSEVKYISKLSPMPGDDTVPEVDSFFFDLPLVKPDVEVPVIEIFLKD